MSEVVFWASVGLVGYTLLGYSTLVRVLARVRARPAQAQPIRPRVSVILAAHNEAPRIADRLRNLLGSAYPPELVEILVGSDGSTDGTVEAARAFEPRVRVTAFDQRRGKAAVLNDLVPAADGEILVFADARQQFDPGAIAALVSHFADPAVGAVSGALILLDADATAAGVEGAAAYWEVEKRIRWAESRLDSTVGVTGAIYAIRRELFEPLPPDAILDDVIVPMRIVRRGFRVLFDPEARAFDQRAATDTQEFGRKVRTIAGNFQMFRLESWLLSPLRNRLWWQTISHKGLRLVLPLCYLTAFGANLLLLDHTFYRVTLAAQAGLLLLGVIACVAPSARRAVPLLGVPYAVGFLTFATIVGFLRFTTGQQKVTW
jgi:cellulose synthase/poly-beta-1,6-N-acetylglucosamine synthase-like glycosyltransferase